MTLKHLLSVFNGHTKIKVSDYNETIYEGTIYGSHETGDKELLEVEDCRIEDDVLDILVDHVRK